MLRSTTTIGTLLTVFAFIIGALPTAAAEYRVEELAELVDNYASCGGHLDTHCQQCRGYTTVDGEKRCVGHQECTVYIDLVVKRCSSP